MNLQAKLLSGILFALILGAQASYCLAESAVEGDPTVDSSTSIPDDTENFSLHGQSTYVLQYKNQFNSPYLGEKSMLSYGDQGKSYSVTGTAFIGARLWPGAEVYYNPEAVESMASQT